MRAIVGAILVLSGSVLVAAGIIASAMPSGMPDAMVGYVGGCMLGGVGFVVLLAGPLRRGWASIRSLPPPGE